MFACDECDREFATKYNLARHMDQFHKENYKNELSCDDCNKKFPSKNMLGAHIINVHGEEDQDVVCVQFV